MMPTPNKGVGERPRNQKKKEGNKSNGGDASSRKMKCHNCGKPGHTSSECRSRPKTRTSSQNNRRDQRSSSQNSQRNQSRNRSGNRKVNFQRDDKRVVQQSLKASPRAKPTAQHSKNTGDNPIARMRCYNCGKNGHAAKDCDGPRKECSICGRLGHVAKDCRTGTPSSGKQGTKNREQKDNGNVPGKEKVCFNCAGTGHIARDCKNEKTVRESSLPWPQKTWISKDVSTLSRDPIKDWSHVELVEIKEFNRLIELSVDISVCKAKLESKILECNKTQQTHMHWNRVNNTKLEIKSPASMQHESLLRMQIAEYEKDKILCSSSLEAQQTKIMKTSIDRAVELQKFYVTHQRDEPQSVAAFLNAAQTFYETDEGIKMRMQQVIIWMNRMYAEHHRIISLEIGKVREQFAIRKATKEAEARVKLVASSGTFAGEDDEVLAKRKRELVALANQQIVSQDHGATPPLSE